MCFFKLLNVSIPDNPSLLGSFPITIHIVLLLVPFSLPLWLFLSQFHLELLIQTSEKKPLIYKSIWERLSTGSTS